MPHPAITRQKNVLSVFSPQIHTHIVEFCKELNEREYDVYILFARKAACFISILENVQLLKLRGKVVSERVLDHDLEWLKGKSIALIDDTVISGTSLFHIIRKLESIGVKSIHVNVFCVNDFWFEHKMLESTKGVSYLQKPYLTVDHPTSLKFCKDIVTLFSLFPRPYSTDFPIFEKLRFIDYEFNELQNFQDWSVVDTTSKIQLAREIRCFSMSPNENIVNGFFESIGVSINTKPYLKLRFYTEKFSSSRTYFLCRVLPLVIFGQIASEKLDVYIKAICSAEKTDYESVKKCLRDNKGALRFVQYYLARRFFLYALDSFKVYLKSKEFKYVENIREIELLFPPHLVEIVRKFQCVEKLNLKFAEENSDLKTQITKQELNRSFNPLLVKDMLYKKFLGLYYEKELEARRLVKFKKKYCVSEPNEQKILNRLNDGFSFEELSEFIAPSIANAKERKLLLSNFLDNAIDSGIVVPVTLDRNGIASRGYRHGEEIVWGENNDKLLGIFYERFLNVTQSAYVGRFWFEKLLVLFLRMGLKERILEEYNYSVPPPQAVSIMAARSYLYGFVTASYELAPNQETKFNPVLDLETKGYWTSERFRDIGAIISNENDENYYLKTDVLINPGGKRAVNEPEDLDSSFSDVAEEIGELLAIAKNDKVLTSEGLVLLTSCLTVHDCIASTAAEIYIYTRHIQNVSNWVKSAVSRKTISIGFLENLRKRHKNFVWPAINSGTDKFLAFLQKDGEKLINDISNHFKKDSFKKRSWDKYWKKEIEVDSAEAPDIFALNTQIGLLLLEINIITIYLHTLIFELIDRNGEVAQLKESNLSLLNETNEKITICTEKLKNLITNEDNSAQTEIVFEKQGQVEKLESERERLRKEYKRISDQIKYWNEYTIANQERTRNYLNKYREISLSECPVTTEAMNTILESVESFSEDKLLSEILRINEMSLEYKKSAERLLTDFSALIPQWGKINPTVRYQGLIHIDTPNTLQSHRNQLKAVINSVMSDFEKEELLKNADSARSIVQLIPVRAPQNIGYFIGGSGRLKIDKMSELVARIRKSCSFLRFPCSIVFYPNLNDEVVPRAFYNPNTTYFDLVHESFYKYFIDIEKGLTKKSNTITIYDPSCTYQPQHYLRNFSLVTGEDYVVNLDVVPAQPSPVEVLTFHTTAKAMKKPKMIGIVTALKVEFEAMKQMLDKIEPMTSEFTPSENDTNDYAFGTIVSKNGENIKVILALMKKMGNNDASATVTHLVRSFPLIEDVIMCGIAGGVPNPENVEKHVRLGDIVVSDKEGVLQYDNIKEEDDRITIRANSTLPSAKLIGICNILDAGTFSFQTPWNTFIDQKAVSFRNGNRPSTKDILRINGKEVAHPNDENRDERYPKVHFGAIGSSNTLLKSEKKRDYLRDNYNVRAIEMEGSGIADGTWQVSKGYLVVRGIVDYCNSDKNDDWRSYAAICAAAYTKTIIQGL